MVRKASQCICFAAWWWMVALFALPCALAQTPRGKMSTLGDFGNATPVYLALPNTPPTSGIILIHDKRGITKQTKNWSELLATFGHVALAVDLYEGKMPENAPQPEQYAGSITPTAAMRNLSNAIRYLKEDPSVQVKKIGVIGWGTGGAWALRLCIENPTVDACVIYQTMPPRNPFEIDRLNTPLFGIYGKKDPTIPVAVVDLFQDALAARKKMAFVAKYDAGTSFSDPTSSHYDQGMAEDAARRAVDFFQRYIKIVPVTQ